jgi:drug/metabolite transporter (DMT)-like permease
LLTAYCIVALFLLLLAIAIFCFTEVIKELPPFIVAQQEIVIATLFIAIGLILFGHVNIVTLFTLPTVSNWFWLGLSGIIFFVGGNYHALRNMQFTGEGNNSLLSPVITVVTSLLAVIFLNDKLTALGFIGLLTTVVAVAAYQYKQVTFKPTKQGFISGWVCIICTSLGIICAIKGTMGSQISLFHSIFLRLFPVFILVLLFNIINKQKLWQVTLKTTRKSLLVLLVAIVLQTIIASYLWFIASLTLGVSKFQVLIALLPFVVVIIDTVILKRKPLTYRFYLTALLAFIGVLLMFWQDLQ